MQNRWLFVLCMLLTGLGAVSQAQKEVIDQDYLTTGIATNAVYERAPCGFRVFWVNWDSTFRAAGLRIGDQVVAVNGVPIPCVPPQSDALNQQARTQLIQRFVRDGIGGLNETQTWKALGLRDGSPLVLGVLRRATDGHERLEIPGTVRHARRYFSASGAPMLALSGPTNLERDGFSNAWSSWYEAWQRFIERPLLDGWANRMDSRRLLTELLAERTRVELLERKYPGAFAAAVRDDFERAKTVLEGQAITLTDTDLEYRRLGEQRAAQVLAAAKQAWTDAAKALQTQTIPAFPAANPLEERSRVVGKVVLLEPIKPDGWISEGGRCYLSAGETGKGFYFVDCQNPAMRRVFDAQYRYQRSVNPKLNETHRLMARILDVPKMLVIRGKASVGLMLEPLGVMVGEAMFVDTRVVKDGVSPFAGEAALATANLSLPPDNASPRQVMDTLVRALKWGDETLWRSLLADTEAWVENGRIGYSLRRASNATTENWVRSRRLILEEVFDVRVVFVSEPVTIVNPELIKNAPTIEEVMVELRHIGRFDNTYRSFVSIKVNPVWRLQRINGGPWRIITDQSI
jgi:hypothetical protein